MRAFLSPVLLLCVPAIAFAHVPILSDGSADSAADALVIDPVQNSRVVYHEFTASSKQLWLTFTIDVPQSVLLRYAVPRIARLADYRPALALLGPGLPEPRNLPFEVPPGLGALFFRTDDVAANEPYFEPFSGTEAWVRLDADQPLYAPGRYYLVAFHPDGTPGKVWLATGEFEVFTPEDFATLSSDIAAVRSFHEVAPRQPGSACFLLPSGLGVLGLSLVRRRI
jgi:hypothetical protein